MSGFAGIEIDPVVVDRARSGVPEAHAAIYRALSGPVYTLALRLVHNPAKAEDILQDTFIEVMRSIVRFRAESSLATWVRHIAVSKALMLLRSAWEKRGETLADASPVAVPAERTDVAIDLTAALGELHPDSRAVVWLHDVEGYTHREIGEMMGRSVSFSKSRLARAHEHLRELLEPANPARFAETVIKTC